MSIYAIGDLHLSVAAEKPMDIFGGWENYMERIKTNWLTNVKNEDTVVLVGDSSWGMTMEEALLDFQFIDELPGKKIVLKGNHDYWWGSVSSMNNFLFEKGITTIDFLHNNHFIVENTAICGSRGWLFENGAEHNEKIVRREAIRIEASLKSVADNNLEKLLFLHYPPVFGSQVLEDYIEIMNRYNVRKCYYGHIHGKGHRHAVVGFRDNIEFFMVSADYIDFDPLKLN